MHDVSAEIGHFLRSRRARIRPDDVGLPLHGHRRVPGLRREETAQLAGVSADYYNRLEQGRAPAVSDAVLDAIARVLRLDETEKRHLRTLARPGRTPAERLASVRPGLRQTIEAMPGVPAVVIGRRTDILGWNALGDALYGLSDLEPAELNATRHTFLQPGIREFYPDWETVAAETVAVLRLLTGKNPDGHALAGLVAQLSAESKEFRVLWEQHPVLERTYGVKRFHHHVAGNLELSFETFGVPGSSDQVLVTYSAPAGSVSDERLKILASWAASASDTATDREP